MVEQKPSKLTTRVRFPSPAPFPIYAELSRIDFVPRRWRAESIRFSFFQSSNSTGAAMAAGGNPTGGFIAAVARDLRF